MSTLAPPDAVLVDLNLPAGPRELVKTAIPVMAIHHEGLAILPIHTVRPAWNNHTRWGGGRFHHVAASRTSKDSRELLAMFPRFVLAVHQPVVREEMRRFLAMRGFEVAVAANGLQCIERLREGLPTVLVLDPHLQWGGGDGVLEWLQDEDPFADVTVVLADGGNYDNIPLRLRFLIHDCQECPGGLHDLQEFVGCLEAHAWRLSGEPDATSKWTRRGS